MNRKKPVTVTWELLDDDRIVVDVDAPLRPFGVDPTPPRGTPIPGGVKALANKVDDETIDDIVLPVTDDQEPVT